MQDQRCFPDNIEIDAALHERQQLFKRDSQPETLKQLRLRRLRQCNGFMLSPRLTGSVLDGTADICSPVQLNLFADTLEELTLYLMEKRIPFELGEVRKKHAGGKIKNHPLIAFLAGNAEIN